MVCSDIYSIGDLVDFTRFSFLLYFMVSIDFKTSAFANIPFPVLKFIGIIEKMIVVSCLPNEVLQ